MMSSHTLLILLMHSSHHYVTTLLINPYHSKWVRYTFCTVHFYSSGLARPSFCIMTHLPWHSKGQLYHATYGSREWPYGGWREFTLLAYNIVQY